MCLFLSFSLLVQEKSAEETFKQIEEMILGAKTMSLRFKCDLVTSAKSGQKDESVFSGLLILKEGDKLNLTVKSLLSDQEKTRNVLSDGHQWRTIWGSGANGGGGV